MSSSRSSSKPSSSSSSSKQSSSRSKSSKPRTAAEIRTADRLTYTTLLLKSHGSYLCQPILSLSASLSLSHVELSIGLALVYLALHLVIPAFMLPHLSALVTLVIPLRNTLVSITRETKAKKNEDCAQWTWYWVLYGLLSLVRGTVGIWMPGWKGGAEIVRSGALVCVGGPWFGFAGLNPPPPSQELVNQEKIEAAEHKSERTKADKKKAEQDKADSKARDKAKDKQRAQRERDAKKKEKSATA